MREPDISGVYGKAWRVPLANAAQLAANPGWAASLGVYVLTVPSAHPIWHSYYLALIHLRDIPGCPPSTKRYPEASYELVLFALNPEHPLPDMDDLAKFEPRLLTPANLVHQFHGVTDGQAAEIVELLVKGFVHGRLSPDTDYRAHTIQSIEATLQHYRDSVHGRVQ